MFARSQHLGRIVRNGLRCSVLAAITFTVAGCDDDDYYFSYYDEPNSISIVDMNGDGRSDLVVAGRRIDGYYPSRGFAGVILQSASTAGTFDVSIDRAAGYSVAAMAVGNLDNASGPDVVVANYTQGGVSVLLHDTSPTEARLTSARSVAVGGDPYDITVGDLNNDGLPDVAVADSSTSNAVRILLRDPASPGHFLAATSLNVGNPSTAVAVGDLNGDGRADLAVANEASTGAGRISVFLQSAVTAGTFPVRSDYAAGSEPLAVRIADVDGDGRNDLVVANEGSGSGGSGTPGVSVLLQDPAVVGTFLPPVTYATARGSVAVAVDDLNGDGLLDIVVANTGGTRGSVSVLLQDATRPGAFLSATNYSGIYSPLAVAIGDLNGDGRPDIAVADGNRATVMFQSATTPGTFAAPVSVGC